MTRPDIREPGDIDAAWLTAVLAEGGVDAEVRSFTSRSVGTGQIGDSQQCLPHVGIPILNACRHLGPVVTFSE